MTGIAEDSKGNSHSNFVSIKDSLAKANEPVYKLKEQPRLISLVSIPHFCLPVASRDPVVPPPPYPSDFSPAPPLYSSTCPGPLPFSQQLP